MYHDTLEKSSNYKGLIYAGYNWHLKKWTWLYSEITGYAISVYLCLYRWTGKEKCYSLAREAGNALLRFQCNKLNYYPKIEIDPMAWFTIHINDLNHDWVILWTNEDYISSSDTTSVYAQESFQIQDGKIIGLNQFQRPIK